jgi:hypothetical protein
MVKKTVTKPTVQIVEVDRSTTEVEATSWYNHLTSTRIDKWRIWPRALITLYGIMFWRVTEWFMALPEPTAPQSAFVSVIVGAGAAWFGLYCGSGPAVSKDKK